MGLTSRQKAAMLLTSLDSATANELLEGISPRILQELTVELANLNASGHTAGSDTMTLTRQFCDCLESTEGFQVRGFLREVLKSTLGEKETRQIEADVGRLSERNDPFERIRSADTGAIASILANEHPHACAVVLSELPVARRLQVLDLLGEGVRVSVAGRISDCESVPPEARTQIAEKVSRLLAAVVEDKSRHGRSGQPFRDIAVTLRGLGKELREGLVGEIRKKDDLAAKKIAGLMVVWEDVPEVADKSLRNALRGLSARILARALVRADDAMTEKILSNLPERTVVAVDEEASRIPAPSDYDIEQARGRIVERLRYMHEKDELDFGE